MNGAEDDTCAHYSMLNTACNVSTFCKQSSLVVMNTINSQVSQANECVHVCMFNKDVYDVYFGT